MAKFLVGALPFVGHIAPMLPVARTLVKRGHEVRFYAGKKFRAKVEATGAEFVPMKAAPDFDDENLVAHFPELVGLGGLSGLKYYIKHVFGDSAVGQVRDWQEVLAEFPADVLLAESTVLGPRWIHELGGPPWAVLNPLPVTLSSRDTAPFGPGLSPSGSALGRLRVMALQTIFSGVLFRDTINHIDQLRAQFGLPPTNKFIMDAVLSPYLYMQATVPGFEYPRSDLPPQVHFIGPVLASATPDFDPPAWWDDLKSGRPVVHVTQGTLATEPSQLLLPTIRELANEDILVIATTGGKPVSALGLEHIPDNVRIEPFIPHAHLLPHVDVMITNGGYNGVQMALSHGVPLIAAGTTEDKPEVCARIAWTGVGINLKTSTPSERQLRNAVKRVLGDLRYRQRAEALAAEYRHYDAPTEAAVLLEELAASGQPVLQRRTGAAVQTPVPQPAD